MKICSFDVGIVHLAYCIIDKQLNNFIIEKWGVINIDENIINCSHIIKNDKQCNKKATYALKLGDNLTYYCTAHKKDHKTLLDDFITKSELNEIGKCCYIVPKSGNICNKKALNQIKNESYCPIHFKGLSKLGKLNQVIATKKSIQNLGEAMYRQLDEIKEMLRVDEVLIENQPTLINPTMKTIASLLYGYFVMRGIVEKQKNNSLIQNIRFISPSNKLKIFKYLKKSVEIMNKEGFYHRDIHYGNIMCDEKLENWYIIDYGAIYNESFIKNTDDKFIGTFSKIIDIISLIWVFIENPIADYMIKHKIIWPPYNKFIKHITNDDRFLTIQKYLPKNIDTLFEKECIVIICCLLFYDLYIDACGMINTPIGKKYKDYKQDNKNIKYFLNIIKKL